MVVFMEALPEWLRWVENLGGEADFSATFGSYEMTNKKAVRV
jgi:hypothetical protein